MATIRASKPQRDTLNLPMAATERLLIDRAAASTGMTCTDFILDAVCRAAEEALLDRALLLVSPEAHEEFLKRLEQPAQPNERLRRTMRSKPPWKAV